MAKFLRKYRYIVAVLFFQFLYLAANAQTFTASVMPHTSLALDQQFNAYQVFQLNTAQLNQYVHSGVESPLQLNIGDHNWRLSLTLNPIVSPNYSLQVGGSQGVVTSYPKHNIAFKGYEEMGGGQVRLTMHDAFLYGYVEEGGERYYIEPLWYFEPMAPKNLFVLYPMSAVAALAPDACGLTEAEIESQQLEEAVNEKLNSAENGACYELDIAIASDESMVTKYGSPSAVEDHNIGVINNVEGDYTGNFNHDLVFVIVTQFVSGSDPWSPSTDAGVLLGSFRTWGNNGGFGVGFDVGELWTNRDFNGGTVGIAYVNAICNSNKYHCLQDYTGNAQRLRVLTSHELGHNFSSGHDANCPPGDFIMCPFVTLSFEWSQQSQNAINNYMQSRINNGCLTACGPPPPPLVAGFGWDPNPGCQGQPVTFTDLSTGNISGWSWNFPGGSPPTSSQQNPTVTWNNPGFKDVTLTITGVGGSNAITQPLEILPLPVANFTYSVNKLKVTFTNTSVNSTLYDWDFGDGFSSNEVNPVHDYVVPGIYIVVLTATNDCGSSSRTSVVITGPSADFTGSPTSGCATLIVAYENLSSSNATTFQWTFPGGTPATTNQPNPSVIYNAAGVYSVTLRATNTSGSDTLTRINYITVGAIPVANFTTSVNDPVVSFTNTTIGSASGYLWDFGDGDTSTVVSPVHTYTTAGTYTVVLTATSNCGSSTKTAEIVIVSMDPPIAGFTADTLSGCSPLSVTYNNTSSGAVSYSWDIPGATPDTSSAVSPTVEYNAPGVYTVTLIATNANGQDTFTRVDYITVNTLPDSADFTYVISNDTTVTFTNTSIGATSYLWTFGDGDSSMVANPVHDYPNLDTNQTYQVIFWAINECGIVSDTQFVTIVADPRADFTATPTMGCTPLTVQYMNISSANATSFAWSFPGGTPDNASDANPVIVYDVVGVYSAILIASNSAGQDTFTRVDYITVNTIPSVGFTYAVSDDTTVTFTSAAMGATSFLWTFGDGDSSMVENPVHTYPALDSNITYTVVFWATNDCGTVSDTQNITIVIKPSAGFTATPIMGCAPLTVQYNHTASANAATFEWSFPGGMPSISSDANPVVVYGNTGLFSATLIVTNTAGSDTFTRVDYITVDDVPMANFTTSVNLLTATFTNTSTGATTYDWDFGDDESSMDANPVHEYVADGTYTVVLTATNDCGTSTFTKDLIVSTEPVANFSANNTSGCAVLTVNFTDNSAGNPVSWEWDFPGGTPSSSTDQNPMVDYWMPGVYDVTLVITSIGGSTSTFSQPAFITVNGAPSAGFTSAINGLAVDFSNSSSGASSYAWNFGDGVGTSTLANPSYAYGEDGVYNVSLSATNTCGTTIFEQTITISTPPTAGFSYSGASGCTPYSVTFTNTSSSNATSLLWDFPGGDPATSTADNPMVVWNTAGVYTVTLTATNASGNSTSTAVITVAAQSTSAFDYQLAGLTATFDNMSSNGTDYTWDFGDGSDPGMEENPIHTYGQSGTYTVVLTVTGECGTVTATQTIEIVGTAPTPAISAENGCIPFEAQFMDESEGDPMAWDWTFEGGTPATSTNQNPLVNYAAPGMYDVTLEVTNIFGSNSTTFLAFITVSETPTAGFTYSANQTTVTFTSTSQNGVNYAWDFGDNTTSTDENPTHTYAAGGSYTVSLSVSNNCGTAIYEETVVITSGTSEATWVSGFQLYPNPSTGVFTVSLEGAPQSEVAFTLFNALGQQVKRDVSEFNTGRLERTFEYGQLAAGFYTLRVEANGEAMYVKVTVSK